MMVQRFYVEEKFPNLTANWIKGTFWSLQCLVVSKQWYFVMKVSIWFWRMTSNSWILNTIKIIWGLEAKLGYQEKHFSKKRTQGTNSILIWCLDWDRTQLDPGWGKGGLCNTPAHFLHCADGVMVASSNGARDYCHPEWNFVTTELSYHGYSCHFNI